jgi:hypothetical protein
MPTESRATGIACVAALVATVLWVHFSLDVSLTAHHDNLDGAAPLRIEAARQWQSGQLPLWNPWKRSGMPLLADTTAGALYPGNAPFLFLDENPGGASVFRALDRVAAINAVLGAVFMYVFLRALTLAQGASVFGALVFACSGTMAWFAAWYIQIQSSAVWLPLILASVLGASGPTMAVWTSIGAAAVALQFFAGFPETSFYSGVIATAYGLVLAVSRGSVRPLVSVAGIYVAGICLAAVQMFPSLELQALSRRPGELPLEVFQSLPATTQMFRSLFVPAGQAGFEFPPLAAYYVGVVAAAAAVAGMIAFFRSTAFFVVLLAVGLLLSLGDATPVNAWLHALPGFSAFRHPFKHLFEVSFALAVLAAFGAQLLLGRPDAAASRLSTGATASVLSTDAAASRLSTGAAAAPLRTGAVVLAIALTGALLRMNYGALAAANPAGVDTSGARPAIVDELEAGWRVLTPRQIFQKRDPAFLVGDYPSQFRVPAIHGAGPFLWSSMAEATGMIEEETTFRPGLFGPRDRTLPLLSGRYLLQTKQKQRFVPAADPSVWKVASETAEVRLLERSDALARVRFAGTVRCASGAGIRASLDGTADDPAGVALLDCTSQQAPAGPFHPPASLSLTLERETPGALVVATIVPPGAAAFLVVGHSDFPGWHAGVDGKRTRIRRVHGLVQGIELPPGTRRFELAYFPLPFLVGSAVSGATLIVLLLWCLVTWRWNEAD